MSFLFSFHGTISRTQFWLAVLVEDVVAFWALMVLALLYLNSPVMGILVAVVLSVPLLWVFCALAVKRLRDAGLSPWLCPLIFVPPVGLVVFCIAGFKPSAVKETGAPNSVE